MLSPLLQRLRLLADGFPDVSMQFDVGAFFDPSKGGVVLKWWGAGYQPRHGDEWRFPFNMPRVEEPPEVLMAALDPPQDTGFSLAYEALCNSYILSNPRMRFLSAATGLEYLCQIPDTGPKTDRIIDALLALASSSGIGDYVTAVRLREIFRLRNQVVHQGVSFPDGKIAMTRTILRMALMVISRRHELLSVLREAAGLSESARQERDRD